jgi:hypothetical protein
MMIGSNWRWLGALVLAAVTMPHDAWAQSGSRREPAKRFEDLQSRTKPGDSVYVTDSKGWEVRAKILDLSGRCWFGDRCGNPQGPDDL